MKILAALVALAALVGCGETVAERAAAQNTSVDAFVGRWRSTTPSLEFARLEVSAPAGGAPAVTARLTLSGLALEAAGPINGDSVVAPMGVAGATQATGTLVIRAVSDGTLSAQLRPTGYASLQNLTFTRE